MVNVTRSHYSSLTHVFFPQSFLFVHKRTPSHGYHTLTAIFRRECVVVVASMFLVLIFPSSKRLPLSLPLYNVARLLLHLAGFSPSPSVPVLFGSHPLLLVISSHFSCVIALVFWLRSLPPVGSSPSRLTA
ncbi:hypothetical protein V8E53_000806 [Lactarius tabidus]